MKNKLHDIIRERLKTYRKECLKCLYPEKGYEWGCLSKKYRDKTLVLVNKIMKNITVEAWSRDRETRTAVASGNWTVYLGWERNRRTADLKCRNDDHTAWCVENRANSGIYIDFDIGGS
jgi:hypothetical protein